MDTGSLSALITLDSFQEQPAVEEVIKWNADKLLEWIQQKEPGLLEGDKLEKFKAQALRGKLFLTLAGNVESFETKCHLPFGPSKELADLASEIAGGETSKLLSFIYLSSSLSSAPLLSPALVFLP
jgi:hypothetical protein